MTPGDALGLFAVASLAACGARPETDAPDAGALDSQTSRVALAPAPSDACGWIPEATVAEILGPLAASPTVVRSIERANPDSAGMACRYDLSDSKAVVLQVDLSGAIIEERVGGAMMEQFRDAIASMAGALADTITAEPATPPRGWDKAGKLMAGYSTFTGRVGHIAISAASLTPGVDPASTAALAERVRDAIPDLPFAMPPDPMLAALAAAAGDPVSETPTGPDPCGLLSAAEAETVLGKLVVSPYRSAENSALADPAGGACAYYTQGHRVFVVQPRWDSGRMLFQMATALGGMALGAIGAGDGEVADTLEGGWDESAASSVTGQLYFLKGDRMLEVHYVTSGTDMAGAARLASVAVRKL